MVITVPANWMIALCHPKETDRLTALQRYDILDSDPEKAFDDITLLARDPDLYERSGWDGGGAARWRPARAKTQICRGDTRAAGQTLLTSIIAILDFAEAEAFSSPFKNAAAY